MASQDKVNGGRRTAGVATSKKHRFGIIENERPAQAGAHFFVGGACQGEVDGGRRIAGMTIRENAHPAQAGAHF